MDLVRGRRVPDRRAGGVVGRADSERPLALDCLHVQPDVPDRAALAARDGLRARLREAWPAGVPVLTEGMVMITSYLAAERDLGRIAPDAEVDMLGPALLGGVHMLFVSRENVPPEPEAITRVVTTVLAGAVR